MEATRIYVTESEYRTLRLLRRAFCFCERWGFRVINDVPQLLPGDRCPYNISATPVAPIDFAAGNPRGWLDWESGILYWPWVRDGVALPNRRIHVAIVLHELAHYLDENPPDEAEESYQHYIAFERAAHRALGTLSLWHYWMRDFYMGTPYERAGCNGYWAQLSPEQRDQALSNSAVRARAAGLFSETNEFTFQATARRTLTMGGARFSLPPVVATSR